MFFNHKYILHRRFKQKCICGEVNIPANTICEEQNGFIMYDNKVLCVFTSEDAHQYFAINDDGNGIKRGKLTQAIQKSLVKQNNHQERWNKMWDSELCKKYKRVEHEDYWLWNHDFFNASIDDLQQIYNLIKEV